MPTALRVLACVPKDLWVSVLPSAFPSSVVLSGFCMAGCAHLEWVLTENAAGGSSLEEEEAAGGQST